MATCQMCNAEVEDDKMQAHMDEAHQGQGGDKAMPAGDDKNGGGDGGAM